MSKIEIYLILTSIIIIILTLRVKKTDKTVTIQFGLLQLFKGRKHE